MSHTADDHNASEQVEPGIVIPAARTTGLQRWLIPSLALVAALVVGLFGGILIGRNAAPAAAGRAAFGAAAANRAGGLPGRLAGAGFTTGTVVSVSGTTVVITTKAGKQVTLTTDASTTISQTTTATLSDLKPGDQVSAIGQADSSGNVTARSISTGSIRPGLASRGAAATPAPTG